MTIAELIQMMLENHLKSYRLKIYASPNAVIHRNSRSEGELALYADGSGPVGVITEDWQLTSSPIYEVRFHLVSLLSWVQENQNDLYTKQIRTVGNQ